MNGIFWDIRFHHDLFDTTDTDKREQNAYLNNDTDTRYYFIARGMAPTLVPVWAKYEGLFKERKETLKLKPITAFVWPVMDLDTGVLRLLPITEIVDFQVASTKRGWTLHRIKAKHPNMDIERIRAKSYGKTQWSRDMNCGDYLRENIVKIKWNGTTMALTVIEYGWDDPPYSDYPQTLPLTELKQEKRVTLHRGEMRLQYWCEHAPCPRFVGYFGRFSYTSDRVMVDGLCHTMFENTVGFKGTWAEFTNWIRSSEDTWENMLVLLEKQCEALQETQKAPKWLQSTLMRLRWGLSDGR